MFKEVININQFFKYLVLIAIAGLVYKNNISSTNVKSNILDEDDEIIEEVRCVNINSNDVNHIMLLEGIGEAKANAIIEYRMENRIYYESKYDLVNISGIGISTIDKFTWEICLF